MKMKDENGINKRINKIDRNTKTTDEIVKQILEDRTHGSSWILIQTIKLLKKIKPENRAEICRKISSSHPAMAGLKALSRAVAKTHYSMQKRQCWMPTAKHRKI
ncbi:MAG: hypothetical protein H0Z28_07195 [Archaeoglobus sp.]|nr:hypothetical protein [Archaeoglobus sp.]